MSIFTFKGGLSISSEKAFANGLKQRPLTETIRATVNWFFTLPLERRSALRAGLDADTENKLLAAWNESSTKS